VIVVLLNVYLVILFVLVKIRIVPFNLFWKISPIIFLLLLLVGLFIPMGWGAPQGSALVVRQSVAIVPDVAGEVLDVPVEPNKPLKAGDVLFRIDPTPYTATVNALEAQLKFQELRLSQMTQLQTQRVGRAFDVEQRQAEVDQLKAQVEGAKWNLDKTVVRAPADGYVTNLALRKGARVANLPLAPVMAFIDTSETIVGVEIPQIDARYVAAGQDVELTSIRGRSKPCFRRSKPARFRPPVLRRRLRRSRRRRLLSESGSTTKSLPSGCRPAAPAPPRSSPIASRSPM
jgi:multidrug resistance efflux pump